MYSGVTQPNEVANLEAPGLVSYEEAGVYITTFSSDDDGRTYIISVLTQPDGPDEFCEITNGSGTISGENIFDVSVVCASEDLIFDDSFE